jgi:hypothetical protein
MAAAIALHAGDSELIRERAVITALASRDKIRSKSYRMVLSDAGYFFGVTQASVTALSMMCL